jgi:hypothetical protein
VDVYTHALKRLYGVVLSPFNFRVVSQYSVSHYMYLTVPTILEMLKWGELCSGNPWQIDEQIALLWNFY